MKFSILLILCMTSLPKEKSSHITDQEIWLKLTIDQKFP